MHRLLPLLLCILAAACTRDETAPSGADPGAGGRTSNEPAPSEDDIVEIGQSAASALTGELMGRVAAAIEEGGPGYAIDFCSTEALPRTSAVADRLGVEIKRTSSRLRNPENAPDPYEQAVLARLGTAAAEGESLPEHVVQNADGEARYYRPIYVAEPCTACHGPRDSLDAAVIEALDTRYPNDEATGYRPGDLRGVIRVSVPGG